MVSKTTAGNVQANNSTGRRNNRVTGGGATDTDVNVLASRDGEAAEASATTANTAGGAEVDPATAEVTAAPGGKLVRRQITAPSRLEKIRKGLDEGKPVPNVMVTRRAGKITAYEMVPAKE